MGIRKTLKNLLGFKSDLASLTVVGVGPGDSSLITIAAVQAIKKAKARRGSTMKIKRSRTKTTSGASIGLAKLNRRSASRSRPNRRSVGRKTFRRSGGGKRKPIST